MKQRRLSILGSTGSIGTQALEIVSSHPDSFRITALSAYTNWKRLAEQANRFRPEYLLLCSDDNRDSFEEVLVYKPRQIIYDSAGLVELAALDETDIVLNSLVGFVGFAPTYAALAAGKRVALANKESLVVGGEILTAMIKERPERLVPIDSEHSAMLQCLVGEPEGSIEKIIITASGGPFRSWPAEKMHSVRVEDALNHPNWSMGAKITIDSSTMMNKGLEILETHWLFNIPYDRIEPVIHPQSVVHSIVEFIDGSSKAQLGPPDMKVPILYALSYPARMPLETPRLNWSEYRELTFSPVDFKRFPCLELAIEAGRAGGYAPTVMNASNEVAVERFLKREIDYIDIPKIVEQSMEQTGSNHTDLSPQTLHEVDREARNLAQII